MTDNVTEYDCDEQYKGYTIKRFQFMQSGGGFAGSTHSAGVSYYHYHVFAPGNSDPVKEAPSLEFARQYVDALA